MLLDTWLPVASDIDSSSENTEYINMQTPLSLSTTCMTPDVDQDEFLRLRRQSINESLDTIRSHSSIEQNRIVFEDLLSLSLLNKIIRTIRTHH
jgi:hypothetical protein